MNKAVLIYPHQIFENNTLLEKDRIVFIIEEPLFFTQYAFHKQKIILHRATMQYYKEKLEKAGYQVFYIDFKNIKKTEDIGLILKNKSIDQVYFFDVVDNWLHKKLVQTLGQYHITFTETDSPLFLTKKLELDEYFLPLLTSKKKLLMHTFYQWQRRRLAILLNEHKKPVGGKWSFDEENRKKIPKDFTFSDKKEVNQNSFIVEAKKYTEKNFSTHYGNTDFFIYPTTHTEAKTWLQEFLSSKLDSFGPYEDAITQKDNFLFHSVLSPLLNIGLLTPEYVIGETLLYHQAHTVPIASLEGFIRQIIGWREYIRAIYVYLGSKERTSNYFNAQKNIPSSFWDGTTGIKPIDHTISTVLDCAYNHHIPRLMIMGNFMNLCGFKPDQVYQWFMEMYIDAYDWVMVPNVYSMALYADGGLITTKPYISGSSYVLKMSDYKKEEWSAIWDALFWNFVGTHFKKLEKEGRLGFIGIQYKKMTPEKRAFHQKIAQDYLQSL